MFGLHVSQTEYPPDERPTVQIHECVNTEARQQTEAMYIPVPYSIFRIYKSGANSNINNILYVEGMEWS